MQKTMTLAKEVDEAQRCRVEIDKLFRAMERSMNEWGASGQTRNG